MLIVHSEHSRSTEQRVEFRKTLSYRFGDAKNYEGGGYKPRTFNKSQRKITNILGRKSEISMKFEDFRWILDELFPNNYFFKL